MGHFSPETPPADSLPGEVFGGSVHFSLRISQRETFGKTEGAADMMLLLSHIHTPQRETEKSFAAKCSQSKPVKYHGAVLRVGRKKHELVLVKISLFGFKIPVLDATISDGEGATSREKYPVLIATKNGLKYPQVSSKIYTVDGPVWKLVVIKPREPKHDLFPTETRTSHKIKLENCT